MMRLLTIVTIAVSSPLAAQTSKSQPPSVAELNAPDSSTQHDETYRSHAADADSYEIAASRLALQRSRNRQIRSFAQMMIAHHTRSAAELARLQPSARLQRQEPQSEPKAQMLQKLRDSKANFDMNYVQSQIAVHEEALELHRTYALSGQNLGLREFAQRALSIVQEHLVKARELKSRR